jgi:hypothetical protein
MSWVKIIWWAMASAVSWRFPLGADRTLRSGTIFESDIVDMRAAAVFRRFHHIDQVFKSSISG